jgi:hypothetical protein
MNPFYIYSTIYLYVYYVINNLISYNLLILNSKKKSRVYNNTITSDICCSTQWFFEYRLFTTLVVTHNSPEKCLEMEIKGCFPSPTVLK